MGELCHFLGREFVCAIFTWPAGGTRGILFGYDVDYESSVYAVEHLRKTIRTIATTPGLERIRRAGCLEASPGSGSSAGTW
jgi:esterase/lipase superfamily enzyme